MMMENRQIFFYYSFIPWMCEQFAMLSHVPLTHQFLASSFFIRRYIVRISLSLSLPIFLVISRREDPEASSSTMPNKSTLVRPGFPPQPLAPESSSPCTFHPRITKLTLSLPSTAGCISLLNHCLRV